MKISHSLAAVAAATALAACGSSSASHSAAHVQTTPVAHAGHAGHGSRHHFAAGQFCRVQDEAEYGAAGLTCAHGHLRRAAIQPAPKKYHAGQACTPKLAPVYKALLLKCVKTAHGDRLTKE